MEEKVYAKIILEDGREYHLAEPTFEVFAASMRKMISKGEADVISAGKAVFDSCYLQNNEPLSEIQKNVNLYGSLCLLAFDQVDIIQGTLKKN